MTPIAQHLLELFIETLKAPRTAARRVLELPGDQSHAWSAFGAMICLSVLLTSLAQFILPVSEEEALIMLQLSPFEAVGMLGGMSLAVLTGIIVIGRLFGGSGTLNDGLRLFAWLQAVLIAFQVVQLIALVLLPVLAALISMVSLGVFFWLLVVFTAEMHRFDGAGTAVFTIILAFTLTSFVLLIVISMLGIVPISETPNV